MLQLFLALLITGVTLLHVLVDTFQSLFVLCHTGLQVFLSLLLLLEHRVVVNLLHAFPVRVHLLLNIKNQRVLEPDAVSSFS